MFDTAPVGVTSDFNGLADETLTEKPIFGNEPVISGPEIGSIWPIGTD